MKELIIRDKYGQSTPMSHKEYEKFNQFKDKYWAVQAKNAAKEGFLLEKESKDFFN
ncbi:toxin-antitoxin system subunit antitoxin [Rickettsia endosymbiont of Gonocerus acuteangulatus]|uniref:toxin-antitoxin system subunit antitoxin n=1 Tax=Rickettsia endosymbiont of Gonocerus acuteangulatus TaxID=3066266 RepID=UPI0031335031